MQTQSLEERHSPLKKVYDATLTILKGDLPASDVQYWVRKAEDLEKNGIFALDVMTEVITGEGKPTFDELVKKKPRIASCIMGELLPAIGRYKETNKKRDWVNVRNVFLEHAPELLFGAQEWDSEYVGYFLESVINTEFFAHVEPIVNCFERADIYSAFIDLLEQKIATPETSYDQGANLLSLKQAYWRVSFEGHLYGRIRQDHSAFSKVLQERIQRIAADRIVADVMGYNNVSPSDYRYLHSVQKDAESWRMVDALTKIPMGATAINNFGNVTGVFLRAAAKQLTGRSIGLPTAVAHMQPKHAYGNSDIDLWNVPADTPIFYTTAKQPKDVSSENVAILSRRMSGKLSEVSDNFESLPESKQRKWHERLITSAEHFVDALQSSGLEKLVRETGRVSHEFDYVSSHTKRERCGTSAYVSILTTDFFGREPGL